MKHSIIMPEDCYISESGRFKGCVVRKTSMGLEVQAGFNEVRYVFGDDSLEQAYQNTAFSHEVIPVDSGPDFPVRIIHKPKQRPYKIITIAE
jgi:hypothetical protein